MAMRAVEAGTCILASCGCSKKVSARNPPNLPESLWCYSSVTVALRWCYIFVGACVLYPLGFAATSHDSPISTYDGHMK
jgi:hypothetical protein